MYQKHMRKYKKIRRIPKNMKKYQSKYKGVPKNMRKYKKLLENTIKFEEV